MFKLLQIHFLILIAVFSGCKEKINEKTKASLHGKWVTEQEYKNDAFGFQITIPKEWFLEKIQNKDLVDQSSNILADNDENFKNQMKEAIAKSHKVLSASRYPLGTPGKPNPNVQVVIENISHLPALKSGSDYLLLLEQNLNASQLKVKFLNKPTVKLLGKSKFYSRNTTMVYAGLNIEQEYYCKYHDGHILFISITSMNEEHKKLLEPIIKSMGKSQISRPSK